MIQSTKHNYLKNTLFLISAFIVISYTGGIVTHLVADFRSFALKITEIVLLLTNLLVLLYALYRHPSASLVIWVILAYIFTFVMEVLGVATNQVFGSYRYGETLMVKAFDVPLIIAFNWVILVLATFSYASLIKVNRWILPFFSATIIVIFDYVMEPVAMALDYWQWKEDVVPLQNYIAWFLIALMLSYYLVFIRVKLPDFLLRLYLFMQFIFFLSLRIFL